mmetsp:Transcript_24439/g.30406  ORF Transcript_24439/g.30406 Transcript_24439/m.30406 type:complete len:294 (+) Transcript_24439:38-919(+)
MKSFAATVGLMAAGAVAWTVDLRNSYEESHTIYLRAGEPLEVLLDGQAGTGFTWINSVDWAQRLPGDQDAQPAHAHIAFEEQSEFDDDRGAFEDTDYDGFLSMGRKHSYRHSFSTKAGQDFEDAIKFVFARSWMLKEFPETRADASADFSSISVVAKSNFAHDLHSDDFNLDALPGELKVREGDLVRLVIRENPTTGHWWHSNARKSLDAPIREVYNGFEAPDLRLIGASGQRILVFEINDALAELRLGLTRPEEEEDINDHWDNDDGEDDDLASHLFSKRIVFSPVEASEIA